MNGAVEIKFVKNGFSDVEIECQRGTEVTFQFLARDTQAPYVDNRANLSDAPETRHYRARYLQKDNPGRLFGCAGGDGAGTGVGEEFLATRSSTTWMNTDGHG